MRIPSRLSRYVLRELLPPTLLGLALYTFVLMMNWAFFVAKDAIAKDLDAPTVGRLLLLFVPQALILSIPMATLLGTLVGVGRLSADHEVVAVQAAGLGPSFFVFPIFVHGAAAAILSAWVYTSLQPAAHYALQALKRQVATINLASNLMPRVFYDDLPGAVLYVDEIPAGGGGRLEGVLLYQADDGHGYEQLTLAREGRLYPSRNEGGAIEIDLRNGVAHSFKATAPETYRPSRFGAYHPKPFEPPAYLAATRGAAIPKQVHQMTHTELLREIRRATQEKEPVLKQIRGRYAWVELHQRIALPLACLLFALLALPLGLGTVRSGRAAGFALSLAVVLVYWFAFTTGKSQALYGRLPASLGVWSGNLAVALWAIVAYARLRRVAPRPAGSAVFTLVRASSRLLLQRVRQRLASPQAPPTCLGTDSSPSSPSSSPVMPPAHPTTGFVALVDRYVGTLYIRSFVFSLLSVYLVFTIVELKGLLDDVVLHHRPLSMVLDYLKYFGPGKLGMVLPISCLVGGIVTLTLLGRAGEMTAAKAAGMSAHRVAAPILVLTSLLCIVSFFVEDQIAPVTSRKAQEVRDRIEGRTPRTYGMPPGGRWTFGGDGRLYHYRLYDPATHTFQGLSAYQVDLETPRILEHRFAELARWNGRLWVAERGWSRTFPDDLTAGGGYERFDRAEFRGLDPPENFARTETLSVGGSDLPEQMPLADLHRQILWLEGSGYDTTRLRMAFHAKLARLVTPLVMVLLGIPFALYVGRRGSLYGIGVALALVIVYWAAFAAFNALGLEAFLPPLLAAWAPNVVFGFLGSYLLLYVRT